jgi:hypothetical protein
MRDKGCAVKGDGDSMQEFAMEGKMSIRNPMTYLILVQGEDEPCSLVRFTTLGAASAYIQEYWQGLDYTESPHRFSTDYAGYVLVNFSLETIGKFVKEPGKNWEYYIFDPVGEEGTAEALRIIYG